MRISDWSSDVCSSDLVLLGEILQNQGRSAEAIAAYRSVPEDSPFSWLVRLRIADELQEMGENELALSALDHLAPDSPASHEPLSRKGDLPPAGARFAQPGASYVGPHQRPGGHRGR